MERKGREKYKNTEDRIQNTEVGRPWYLGFCRVDWNSYFEVQISCSSFKK